jgi:hypothetical protein
MDEGEAIDWMIDHQRDSELTREMRQDQRGRAVKGDLATMRAMDTLDHYQKLTNSDDEHILLDLLADLMHWASSSGKEFDLELEKARKHYSAEKTGGRHG